MRLSSVFQLRRWFGVWGKSKAKIRGSSKINSIASFGLARLDSAHLAVVAVVVALCLLFSAWVHPEAPLETPLQTANRPHVSCYRCPALMRFRMHFSACMQFDWPQHFSANRTRRKLKNRQQKRNQRNLNSEKHENVFLFSVLCVLGPRFDCI